MEKKIYLLKNIQHSLLDDQVQVLRSMGFALDDIIIKNIPANGMNLQEIDSLAKEMNAEAEEDDISIIFVTPLMALSFKLTPYVKEYVFFNENREKKELPNGKIINVIAKTGWQLVKKSNRIFDRILEDYV